MASPTSLAAVLLGLAVAATVSPACAGAADYGFEPIRAEVKLSAGSELAVRLVHRPTGKAIAGAVLFRTRLDMAPDKMPDMTAKHEAVPSTEPGVYRFKADLTMAGSWAFRVMAKVPGEAETLEATVIFKAKD